MKKKIYFAGSIRGGRDDANLYKRMINYLKVDNVVLTEHVGNDNLSLEEQGRERDASIYNRDTDWLRESDVLIGECTCPSLGVGYELAYAERLGIPCHIFYNKAKTQLSAMLTGNLYFKLHPYENEDEIFEELDKILNKRTNTNNSKIDNPFDYTNKEVLTSDEAARYMGMSKSYLYKLTMRRQIPHFKPLGKMCYFNRKELEAWLQRNRVATMDEIEMEAQAYCMRSKFRR